MTAVYYSTTEHCSSERLLNFNTAGNALASALRFFHELPLSVSLRTLSEVSNGVEVSLAVGEANLARTTIEKMETIAAVALNLDETCASSQICGRYSLFSRAGESGCPE
jgi:hypothetical protein